MNGLVQYFIKYRFLILPTVNYGHGEWIKATNSKEQQYSRIILFKMWKHTYPGRGPQIKFAFLREQLLLAAALLWWKCNKASVSVQQIKNKRLSITSRHLLRQILRSNYPGTKGHQGGINWIPICASSHQVSLLGRPLMHAKDSRQDSTVVIRSQIAWALYWEWNQSLLFWKGRASTADQWGADVVLQRWWTPCITAGCCGAQRELCSRAVMADCCLYCLSELAALAVFCSPLAF